MSSSKIGFSRGIKLKGNINRILEMVAGGMGDHAIAGHFKDEEVEITSQCVRIIRTEMSELTRKAVTKASTSQAIKAANHDKDSAVRTGKGELLPQA